MSEQAFFEFGVSDPVPLVAGAIRDIEKILNRPLSADLQVKGLDFTALKQGLEQVERVAQRVGAEIRALGGSGTGRTTAARNLAAGGLAEVGQIGAQLQRQLGFALQGLDLAPLLREAFIRTAGRGFQGTPGRFTESLRSQALLPDPAPLAATRERTEKFLSDLRNRVELARQPLSDDAKEAQAIQRAQTQLAKDILEFDSSISRMRNAFAIGESRKAGTAVELPGGAVAIGVGVGKPQFFQSERGNQGLGAEVKAANLEKVQTDLAIALERRATAEKRAATAAEKEAQASLELQRMETALRERWRRVSSGFVSPSGQPFAFSLGGNGLAPASVRQAATIQAQLSRQTEGLVPGFLQGLFGRGFGGGTEGPHSLAESFTNLAVTAGSVAKYTLLYNALFSIKNAMSDTLNEASRYNESLRDLSVAMTSAHPASQQFLDDLSSISRLAGENPRAAITSAARGIRAFTTPDESTAQIESAGQSVADASNKIALITGSSMQDATGNVIAIASAFGLAAEQANQVVDAISGAKTQGGFPTDISQGLANVASVAAEAGFSLEQTANMVSLVSARVDESGQTAATRVARILGILSGTTGRSIIGEVNSRNLGGQHQFDVDPTGTVAQQLEMLAKVYQEAGKQGDLQLQGLIRSKLGGAANQRELEVVLNSVTGGNTIFGAQQEPGRGDAEFRTKMNSLIGDLKKIAGDVTNLQVDLVNSHLFDGFGAGIKVLETALHLLDQFLKTYNELIDTIPGGDQAAGVLTAGAELAAIVAGVKALSARGGLGLGALGTWWGGVTTAFRSAGTASATAVEGAGAAAAAGVRAGGAEVTAALGLVAAEVRVAGAGQLALFEGGAAGGAASRLGRLRAGVGAAGGAAAGFLSSGAGIATLTVGALILGAAAYQTLHKDQQDLIDSRLRSSDALRNAGTSGDFEGAARAFRELSATTQSSGGTLGFLTSGRRKALAQSQTDLADFYDQLAAAAKEREQAAAAGLRTSYSDILGNVNAEDADGIRANIAAFKEAGGTTSQVFDALQAALRGLIDPAQRLVDTLSTAQEATAFAAGNQSTFTDIGQKFGNVDLLIGDRKDELAQGVQTAATRPDVLAAVQNSIKGQLDAKRGQALNSGQIGDIADTAAGVWVNQMRKDGYFISPELESQLRLNFQHDLYNKILEAAGTTIANPSTPDEFLTNARIMLENQQGKLDRATGPKARIAVLRSTVQYLRASIRGANAVGGAPGEMLEDLANAESALVDARIEGAITLAKHDQANGKMTRKEGNRRFSKLANWVLDHGTIDQLIKLMDAAAQIQVSALLAQLDAAAAAEAAADAANRRVQAVINDSGLVGRGGEYDSTEARRRAATAHEADRRSSASQDKNHGGAWLPPPPDTSAADEAKRKAEEARQRAEDLAKAQAQIVAARKGGDLAAATAAVKQATISLKYAKGDALATAQAMSDWYNAQRQLREAMLNYRSLRRRLNADLTDPVVSARQDLIDAQRKLASDRRNHQGRDVLAQDRLDVEAKQNALESAKQQQRLADIQTAEQLGRISHAQYIRWLQNEHNRLSDMAHRTRQQQEYLNQVDMLLKEAADAMDSQFNLGDIKLPTVYEVRRSIGEGGTVGSSTQNVNITINGADLGAIYDMMSRFFGPVRTGSRRSGVRA